MDLAQICHNHQIPLTLKSSACIFKTNRGGISWPIIKETINDSPDGETICIGIYQTITHLESVYIPELAGNQNRPGILGNRIQILIPVDSGKRILKPSRFSEFLCMDGHQRHIGDRTAVHGNRNLRINQNLGHIFCAFHHQVRIRIRLQINPFIGIRVYVTPCGLKNQIRTNGITKLIFRIGIDGSGGLGAENTHGNRQNQKHHQEVLIILGPQNSHKGSIQGRRPEPLTRQEYQLDQPGDNPGAQQTGTNHKQSGAHVQQRIQSRAVHHLLQQIFLLASELEQAINRNAQQDHIQAANLPPGKLYLPASCPFGFHNTHVGIAEHRQDHGTNGKQCRNSYNQQNPGIHMNRQCSSLDELQECIGCTNDPADQPSQGKSQDCRPYNHHNALQKINLNNLYF